MHTRQSECKTQAQRNLLLMTQLDDPAQTCWALVDEQGQGRAFEVDHDVRHLAEVNGWVDVVGDHQPGAAQ